MKKSVVVLLHVGYWVIYLLLLSMFFVILNIGKMHITLKILSIVLFFKPFGWSAILPALIGFYTFYSILFDRYLKKKKILKLFLSAAAFAFIGSIITELVIYVAFHNQGVNWGG